MPGPRGGCLCRTDLELKSRPRDDAGLHVSQVMLSLRLMYYRNPQNLPEPSEAKEKPTLAPPGGAGAPSSYRCS